MRRAPASAILRRVAAHDIDPLATYCKKLGVATKISPGLDPRSPALDGVGDRRYALGPELGRGGGGRVLLGVDRNLRRSVAVKLLAPERASDPGKVQAFIEEAIITAGLEHPNIAPAYELGVSDELGLYYTMKPLNGRALHDIIHGVRIGDPLIASRFGLFRLLGCFVDMCRAIAYAHSRGVIHTDLKPGNVVIGEFGDVAVVDWGLAQILGPAGQEQARAGWHAGTPEYMSPEQVSGPSAKLDGRTDVWALGVILYELLTLTRPFRGNTSHETMVKVLYDDIELPSKRTPERPIPLEMERICMKALERDRELRYQTAGELLSDIDGYLEGTREQLRRSEVARHAMDAARAVLDPLVHIETQLDAKLARLRIDGGSAADETLAQQRNMLLEGYEQATHAVLRGMDAQAELTILLDAAGDLYWRTFTRIYPSHLPPEESVARRANELLTLLTQRALGAIVRIGKRMTHSAADATTTDDPWLAVVSALCARNATIDAQAAPSAMSELVERIAFLKNLDLFAQMAACDLLPIAELCQTRLYDDGAVISQQGEVGDQLFVVLDGEVNVIRDGVRINALGSGEVIGELGVLSESTRTASLIANMPVTLLALSGSDFRQIVRDNGDIGLALIQFLIERMRFATEREAKLRSSTPVV